MIFLPFTMPFRTDQVTGLFEVTRHLAIYSRWLVAGLFTAGLVLETLADFQIDAHKKQQE